MQKRFFLALFVFLTVFSPSVLGLALMGENLIVKDMFTPGLTKEYRYTFVNNDGIDANYVIFKEKYKGEGLSNYIKIEPDRFENVKAGESRSFLVHVELPQDMTFAGENEDRIWVRGTPISSGGGITASPVVGIRYIVFVSFPYKYVEWNIIPQNLNVNETTDFIVSVRNLGKPDIGSIYADVDIINTETNLTMATLRSDSGSLKSLESKNLLAKFDSHGYTPGDYIARATLHFDENVSVKENSFMIGHLFVAIKDYTREFEKETINKMNINIESRWNRLLRETHADVQIFDRQKTKVADFRTISTDLNPWETKTIEGYFDTKGLPLGEYDAQITLYYQDAATVENGNISILEQAGTEKYTETPKKSFGAGLLTSTNLLILILILFVIVNIAVLVSKKSQKKSSISPEAIDKIEKASSRMTRDDLAASLRSKGWSEEDISEILKRTKK